MPLVHKYDCTALLQIAISPECAEPAAKRERYHEHCEARARINPMDERQLPVVPFQICRKRQQEPMRDEDERVTTSSSVQIVYLRHV